ncbi:uncharacterized protein LOC132174221 [Corylus avellana]|uniref:uncharacterized protein LOC132174221 n=1 Tax=Corylus avellana TaxID=13451 RepID=UPI00286D2EE6|nr:uncharacterized protein LOC132174221 [Corylus avellana]
MGKPKTIDAFFKEKDADSNSKMSSSTSNPQTLAPEQRPSKMPRIESQVVESFDISTLQYDPGLRPQIWECPINQQDEIRCAYLKVGPNRFIPSRSSGYLFSGTEKNRRRSQSSWYKMFDWLESSKDKDTAYCLPCFLFAKKPTGWFGGNGPCSPHNNTVKCCDNLKNQSQHIDKRSRGNFLELIKLVSNFNDDVAKVVLENAPQNAKYTSPQVQKDILHVLAKRVQDAIREEIERFFDIVQVKDTSALTLKDKISDVLSQNCLDIQSIRGQGYDGASNMCGEWKGLQALFFNECSCASYVHCFAHRLQLALVTASREAIVVHDFFSNLNFIINVVSASCKRHRDLQDAQKADITYLIAINELETEKGANQISTLKRAGNSR